MKIRFHISKLLLILVLGSAVLSAQEKVQGTAMDRLMQARIFALGPVGFVGMTSQEEKDYRKVFAQPDALPSFEKLYANGNSQARTYALIAIRQLSPARFNELSASLDSSSEMVMTMRGCIGTQKLIRDVVRHEAEKRANPFNLAPAETKW